MKILVSGGTGYIGSHTCVELLNKGYDVVAFDNLYNSKIDVVDRVEKITGKKLIFYKADMLDKESMRPIFLLRCCIQGLPFRFHPDNRPVS